MVPLPRFRRLEAIRIAVCQRTGFPLVIWFWWLVAAGWGTINARFYRDLMNPDGISYLDLADEALKHGPLALVNAHWGPLYPALIALWKLILRPSPFQEFAHVHALNAVIYLAAAVAFGWFLRELIMSSHSSHSNNVAGFGSDRGPLCKQWAFISCAFAIFCRYTNAEHLPPAVTPDILLSATVFAAGALFFRIVRKPSRNMYFALSGVLALGYFAKSIILPAGIVLLLLLWACQYRFASRRANLLLAAAALCLFCAPQIGLISRSVGYPSFGETGRLNYLWSVQQVRQFEGWTGTPGGDMPIHGPRLLMSDPEVLEFAQPIAGTYPLWYDPVYWHAGAKIHFDFSQAWGAFKRNLYFYKTYFAELSYPLAGLSVLIILAGLKRLRPGSMQCWFLLWPLGVLLMYGLLYIEFRYAAPWLVLIWVASYSAFLSRQGLAERLLLILVAGLILIPRLMEVKAAYPILAKSRPALTNVIAQYLSEMGLQPGDPIATVGEGFRYYFARTARVRIIAQITNESDFWSRTPSQVLEVEKAVAGTGAKALIAIDRPPDSQYRDWQVINETRVSVLRLNSDGH